VFVGLVVVLVTAVAVGTGGRLPLWATLLGAAAFAGAYEATYTAAPPEVTSTSVSVLTALLMTVVVGFLAAAAAASEPSSTATRRTPRGVSPEETHRLNDMMETK
jgi:hypothetical protein